ncbi:MAG: polymerase [Pseudomonadota bacterium]
MPAFDQGLRHADGNHQHAEIIKIPDRDARYLRICERTKFRENQQVRNDKQNRAEMPDDLRPQEDWLQKNTPLLGVSCLEIQNTEADDLIAAYAVQARREGAEVVIATNDKDILQIVGEGISIYSTVKNDIKEGAFALLGIEAVRGKWGVDPAHIADEGKAVHQPGKLGFQQRAGLGRRRLHPHGRGHHRRPGRGLATIGQ